jgi:hypothetical protein
MITNDDQRRRDKQRRDRTAAVAMASVENMRMTAEFLFLSQNLKSNAIANLGMSITTYVGAASTGKERGHRENEKIDGMNVDQGTSGEKTAISNAEGTFAT